MHLKLPFWSHQMQGWTNLDRGQSPESCLLKSPVVNSPRLTRMLGRAEADGHHIRRCPANPDVDESSGESPRHKSFDTIHGVPSQLAGSKHLCTVGA